MAKATACGRQSPPCAPKLQWRLDMRTAGGMQQPSSVGGGAFHCVSTTGFQELQRFALRNIFKCNLI